MGHPVVKTRAPGVIFCVKCLDEHGYPDQKQIHDQEWEWDQRQAVVILAGESLCQEHWGMRRR